MSSVKDELRAIFYPFQLTWIASVRTILFCYICVNVVLPNCQAKIIDFVKKAYWDHFAAKLGDQDKPFAPYFCCKRWVEYLRDWRNSKKKSLPFSLPMVRREKKDPIMHCCFCMINLKGINHRNKHYVQYPEVPFAIRPIPHGVDLSIPESDGNKMYSSDFQHWGMTVVAEGDAYKSDENDQPVPFT